jgi:predicted metal-dependent phosphoesterase TrpH
VFKIDLHIHSSLGGDSNILPEELVPHAKKAGLDAVCVTEHHAYSLSEPFDKISQEAGFPVFRGMEYRAAEGHLLIYGINIGRSDMIAGLPMQIAIDWVQERGGVAIPAHPYQKDMVGGALGDKVLLLKGLFALEAANGSVSADGNRRAHEAAAKMGIKGTGGSDAHGLYTIGKAFTIFSEPVLTERDLVETLRSGSYRPGFSELV